MNSFQVSAMLSPMISKRGFGVGYLQMRRAALIQRCQEGVVIAADELEEVRGQLRVPTGQNPLPLVEFSSRRSKADNESRNSGIPRESHQIETKDTDV